MKIRHYVTSLVVVFYMIATAAKSLAILPVLPEQVPLESGGGYSVDPLPKQTPKPAEAQKPVASTAEAAKQLPPKLESAPAEPTSIAIFFSDPQLKTEYTKMLSSRIAYNNWALEERKHVYVWTNRIGYAIGLIVHGVLFLGIWAAVHEFQRASKARKRNDTQQEFSLSLEGFALKTSLHGTLLLLISIGLYFLYLKYIYTVATSP